MSEWQPIETAPKDGTEFLAVRLFQNTNAHPIIQVVKFVGDALLVAWDHDDEFRPQYWQPLPEPPK